MTTRYCIHCGLDIGDALACSNPECGGLPNFYRDIAGPERADFSFPAQPASAMPAPGPRQTVQASGRATRPGAGAGPRQTLAGAVGPVALLRGVTLAGTEHILNAGVNEVGARRPAAVVIDRPQISSRHAAIECVRREDGTWGLLLHDHGSTNGTFVAGERVTDRALKPGDKVRFADFEYEVRVVAEEGPRVTMRV